MATPKTIKLYDGPSELDGERIIVLLTGLGRSSANTKTGDMLQTWIMRYDVKPNEAVKTGKDASVCGNCPLRPYLAAQRDRSILPKPCYVKVYQAPRSTWAANRDLPVTDTVTARALIAGRKVRRGSYGDPAAAPASVWDCTSNPKDTGYSHQWRNAGKAFASHLMASVHTLAERAEAKAKGWRTFRVVSSVDELVKGEILCPASKEAGVRSTCATCGLCNGTRPNDKRKDIAIVAH